MQLGQMRKTKVSPEAAAKDWLGNASKSVIRYANPVYYYKKLKEDLGAFYRAVRNRKEFSLTLDRAALEDAFRGKLFGCFFLSGAFSFVGIAIGGALQVLTRKPSVGLFATIVLVSLICTAGYQLIWWLDNKKLYLATRDTPWGRFMELQRDLIPVHLVGFKLALIFGFLTIPINVLIIVVASAINESIAPYLPMPVLVFLIDFILVQQPLMRLMGDAFERHSKVLADKYTARLSVVSSAA